MKQILITLGLLSAGSVSMANANEVEDLKKNLEYQTGRIEKLQEQNDELLAELNELKKQLGEEVDATPEPAPVEEEPADESKAPTYHELLTRAAGLQNELEGKLAVLAKFQFSFLEKLPFRKGETLGTFTDAKGEKYEGAIVSKVDGSGVTITHSQGVSRLTGKDFPEGFREGFIMRPEGEDLGSLLAETLEQRPASVYKSVVFEGIRDREARREAAAIASIKPVDASVIVDREQERKNELIKLDESIRAHNLAVDEKIKAVQAKLTATRKSLNSLETSFRQASAAFRPVASGKEAKEREQFINQYYDQQAKLNRQISDIEREIRALEREKKTTIFHRSDQPEMSLKERQQLQTDIREMRSKLEETKQLLLSKQEARNEAYRQYEEKTIKGDRKLFEEKMQRVDAEIEQLESRILAMKNKILETESQIR